MTYALPADAALLQPVRIGYTDVRNRLFMAPLTRSRAQADGTPSDLAAQYYSQRAAAGLIISEATAVSAAAHGAYLNTPGIYTERHESKWAEIADEVHEAGGHMFVQLWHVGRMGHPDISGVHPVAPSAIAADVTTHTPTGKQPLPVPRALRTDEIAPIVEDFRVAARRAVDAGMDGVEIHGANGYLLHEFLSPLSNVREDEYGGSLENRARLILEIVRAVRAEAGEDVPLLVRFSATDWVEDGWDLDQTTTVAGWAIEAGADLFDISTGGLVSGAHIPTGPGYQVPFAEHVRTTADASVSAVGLITTAEQAEEIVSTGQADAVMMGREMMRDPHFTWRAARDLGVHLDYYPPQYLRARPEVNDGEW